MQTRVRDRLELLVSTNVSLLEQGRELIAGLSDDAYGSMPAGLEPHRASGHLRHVLEFYECFLAGLNCGAIDYDARRRDARIERSRNEAVARMDSLISHLARDARLRHDSLLRVRAEDAPAHADAGLASSVARELQVLASHTVHHFAVIAVTLKALGCAVDPSFGMAPSTLRYAERLRAAA